MGRSIWVSILSLQRSPSDLNCAAAASRCGAKQWKKTPPSANGNPCGPKWKICLRKRTIRSHFDLASFQFRFRRCFQMETTTCDYPDVNGVRGTLGTGSSYVPTAFRDEHSGFLVRRF